MYELTGKITGVSFSWSGNPLITFELNERKNALDMVDALSCHEKLTVNVAQHKEKRSLDANKYFHLLVNKIAAKVKSSDDEVKRNLVCRYGPLARDENGELIGAMIPVGQDISSFYPYTRCYKTEIYGGKECNCYLFYKRTRDMDKSEFSRLIDGTVSEAMELGIETKSREEIDSLLNSWGK